MLTPSPDCPPLWQNAPEQRGALFPYCMHSRQLVQTLTSVPAQPSPSLGGELSGLPVKPPIAPEDSRGEGFISEEGLSPPGFVTETLVPGKVEKEDHMSCLCFVFSG